MNTELEHFLFSALSAAAESLGNRAPLGFMAPQENARIFGFYPPDYDAAFLQPLDIAGFYPRFTPTFCIFEYPSPLAKKPLSGRAGIGLRALLGYPYAMGVSRCNLGGISVQFGGYLGAKYFAKRLI